MAWQIETEFSYGWENVSSDGDGQPLTFRTRREAQAALREYREDRREAGMSPVNCRITRTPSA